MDIQEVPELKTETTNGIPEPDRAFLVVRRTFRLSPRELPGSQGTVRSDN